ncbi:hypothetical protein PTTG_06293 [Puccinia triticina 1-1 BBBD Race 1]|uniref:DEAD/DEAH box helicase domain-containing protein n=1 Tax=Puccinia triticina (isolate 1-1 / race 1 (BBBD)) TaxID=630390 RepID=A0A0C4EZN4_PUCT1|nr:hypothetical protein PTTG_06293 [Puccinia triticina 1-1 BBBD Race 1]
MIRPKKSPPKSSLQKSTGGVTVLKKLLGQKENALKNKIASEAKKFYDGQDAKPLQVVTVASLAQGKSTFLLAGTGFGKSRIPEMYDLLGDD